MHFEIHKAGRVHLTSLRSGCGDWRWELLTDDGAVIASGDGYQSKAACRTAVEQVKGVGHDTPVIDRQG